MGHTLNIQANDAPPLRLSVPLSVTLSLSVYYCLSVIKTAKYIIKRFQQAVVHHSILCLVISSPFILLHNFKKINQFEL